MALLSKVDDIHLKSIWEQPFNFAEIVENKCYPSFPLAKGVHVNPSSVSDNVYCFPWKMKVSSIFSSDHRAVSETTDRTHLRTTDLYLFLCQWDPAISIAF